MDKPRDQAPHEGRRCLPRRNSALTLVTARLKYISENEWGKRRYLDMTRLEEMGEQGRAEAQTDEA